MDKETLDFVFTVLDNRIDTFKNDLEKLSKLQEEENDLNPVAIDDIRFVIDLSMNNLLQFRKELIGCQQSCYMQCMVSLERSSRQPGLPTD